MLYASSISADGRYVAYASHDLGSSIGDTNGVQDVFVRDVETGLVQPVSVDSMGRFTNQFHSQSCVLSADGRRVAWLLVTPGYYASCSVHWRDLTTGETRVVSEMFSNLGAFRSFSPAISADGRWVAYESSRPTPLIEPGVTDQNAGSDIILQDVEAGTNTVISRSATGTTSGNNYSFGPRFSRDGRWLAFGSRATNLTTNQGSSSTPRLFVRDLLRHITIDVSGAPSQGQTSTAYSAGEAVFSDDSRFLAFNAGNDFVSVYDLTSNTRTTVCSQCRSPALSGDGTWVAVTALYPVGASGSRVQLLNRLSGDVSILGTNLTRGVLTGPITRNPVLSGDGRYLIFTADPRLAYPRPSPVIYVRDLARGLTMPLPLDPRGGTGNAGSYVPQFAADGRTLVLASFASDLVPADHNCRGDIFVVRIGAPDSDGDSLDDDWEVAYFNDLSQGAAGDFDEDGQSNRDEFRAGTDPTNASSVLSVMVVVSLPGNDATLTWNSVAGRVYDVQYKNAMEEGWSTLYANVVADGGMRSVVDNLQPRPPQRFYRVVFTP
jgi:Tol biopolymer transport system component